MSCVLYLENKTLKNKPPLKIERRKQTAINPESKNYSRRDVWFLSTPLPPNAVNRFCLKIFWYSSSSASNTKKRYLKSLLANSNELAKDHHYTLFPKTPRKFPEKNHGEKPTHTLVEVVILFHLSIWTLEEHRVAELDCRSLLSPYKTPSSW